jgi:hypothetical protein
MTHTKTGLSGESHAEKMARIRRFNAEQDRKYGGPAEPLTEEQLDRSETEVRNHLRHGASHSSKR